MALSQTICRHVVSSGKPLVVADAQTHPLARNEAPIQLLGIGAYLGVPLTTAEGEVVGVLCTVDRHAREWSPAQIEIAEGLAAAVMTEIGLRRAEPALPLADREHSARHLHEQRRRAVHLALHEPADRAAARLHAGGVGGEARSWPATASIRTTASACRRSPTKRASTAFRPAASSGSSRATGASSGCSTRRSRCATSEGTIVVPPGLPARHHRAEAARGAAAPVAEDGGDRPARRRDRARLQQHADGDQRLRRAARLLVRRGRSARGGRRPGPEGRRSRRGPDPAAAHVQPQAGAAAPAARRERRRPRPGADARPHDRRRGGVEDVARGWARARRDDPDQLAQVVLNMAINGRDAMPAAAAHDLDARSTPRRAFVSVEITDTGTGMDEETRTAPSSRSSPRRTPARARGSVSRPRTASSARAAAGSRSTRARRGLDLPRAASTAPSPARGAVRIDARCDGIDWDAREPT